MSVLQQPATKNRSPATFALVAMTLCGMAIPTAGAQTPPTASNTSASSKPASTSPPAATPAPAPDADLWATIERLTIDDPSLGGSGAFATRIERRRQLLEALRAYRAAYPGAAQVDEACRRELATLFELGTLAGGEFGEFQRLVDAWLTRPPTPAALHEAAYWQIELRSTRGEFGNVRVRLGDAWWEPARLASYRDYAEKYPHSRHVPRIATILYDDAARRNEREEMRAIATRLTRDWPDSGVAEQLSADLRRRDAAGKPFSLRAPSSRGEVDTTTWRGQIVLIVVWTSIDAADRELVARVEAQRATRGNVRVIGVNLDQSVDAMQAAARAMQVDWPQVHDGRGWAGEFVRTWGVRESPMVFVIDTRGNLVGSTGGDEWLRWLDEAAR